MLRPHHIHLVWHFTLKTYRVLTVAVLVIGFVFAALMLTVRYYLLPDIDRYREPIASVISNSLKQRVTIGQIAGSWTGARPSLSMRNVVLHDQEGRPALELAHVDTQIAWRSLLVGEVRLHSLVIDQPDLVVRRDTAGKFYVAGIPISVDGGDNRFSDWLLAQVEIQVRRARVAWFDEKRGAPPLMLTDVEFHLDNTLGRHRVSVRALPAAEYGSAVEFSGDLRRQSGAGVGGWLGKGFLRCEYLNLGAVRTWVDLPVDISSGAGAFDIWAELGTQGLASVITDVRMVGFSGKLAADAPPLDLKQLQGRLTWRALGAGFEIGASQLAFRTAEGRLVPPTDFSLRHIVAANGTQTNELEATLIDVTALSEVAVKLPLGPAIRERIARHAPRGKLENLKASWQGPVNTPDQLRFEARADRVAISPVERIPGFSGITGQVQVTPQGGAITLDSTNATLTLSRVLAAPLTLDSLKAQVDWTTSDGLPRVNVKQASFANADAAGQFRGVYTGVRSGPGNADFSGGLSRGTAQAVWKYVPLIVPDQVRNWLKAGLKSGYSNDVKFTLRGNLQQFPFEDAKQGLFEVIVVPKAVTLEYVPGWPAFENAEGKLTFRARRMDIEATGTILGARVERSTIAVADLGSHDPLVEIKGEAKGATQDYLRYLNQSGMSRLVNGITEKMQAKGEGQLTLDMQLPLKRVKDVKLQGTFVGKDNTLESKNEIPTLHKLSGTLEFSETGVRVTDAKAEAFGGPISFSITGDAKDGVTINANGRATAAQLQRELGSPWLSRLAGETGWKGTVTVKNKRPDIVVESDLRGMALTFPAPLTKAKDEVLPFKLLRRARDREEWMSVALGKKLTAELAIDETTTPARIKRGQVDFGPNARLPSAPGVTLTGTIPAVDLDQWLELSEAIRAKGDAAASSFDFAGADLRVSLVEVFGRTIHDARLNLKRNQNLWEGRLVSREVEGHIDWVPEGRGKLIARLSRLNIPEPDDGAAGKKGEPMSGRDLPALDIEANSFKFGKYEFGSMTLKATPNGPGWRLDGLDIQNPESSIVAQGRWELVDGKPRSQMSVWMDVNDIGSFLQRIRYPDTVRDGKAKLIGDVSWEGSPYQIDYATLSGDFTLEARKGRFLKAEPGIGKLIGILNLQALPRRITLDFRDVFRQGFVFDAIDGDFRITKGVVSTKKDLKMDGPTARVRMHGNVDLKNEKQDLIVKVIPSLSDSVAVGATILNPLVGIATFLAGKALNDPIDQIIAFEYKITGDLAEPVVEKVVRQPKVEKSGRE